MSTPEDLYKEKFSNYEPKPPQHVWSAVNRGLGWRSFLQFDPRRINVYYAAVAAGVLALAVYAGWGGDAANEDLLVLDSPAMPQYRPAERFFNILRADKGASLSVGVIEDVALDVLSGGSDSVAEYAALDIDSSAGLDGAAADGKAMDSSSLLLQQQELPAWQLAASDRSEKVLQEGNGNALSGVATPIVSGSATYKYNANTRIEYASIGTKAIMEARNNGTGLSYAWDFGDGHSAVGRKVHHEFGRPGSYRVRLNAFSKELGVSDTVYRDVVISAPEYSISFPNAVVASLSGTAFAPKGNTAELCKYRLAIYNRSGKEVFSTMDPGEGWNGFYKGERLPKGVYVYRVSYEFINGDRNTSNGSITLFWEENTNLTIHP